jgi:hypothetical protein
MILPLATYAHGNRNEPQLMFFRACFNICKMNYDNKAGDKNLDTSPEKREKETLKNDQAELPATSETEVKNAHASGLGSMGRHDEETGEGELRKD